MKETPVRIGFAPTRRDCFTHPEACLLYTSMYHQVKRMFGAYGITVTALRRDAIGGLALDPDLEPGKCRKLSKIEVERILTEGL